MAGYTRQDTANNIANGNVIDADDFDAEYNALENAFNASTGHKHDGNPGEGAPVTVVGPSQDLIVSGTNVLPKTTNTLDLGSTGAKFKNSFFDGTVTTDDLAVTGGSVLTGNATVGGTLGVTGATTLSSTAAITGNTTVGGTLGVTGASTLDSAAVTNNATVGGTLGVTGNTTVGGTLGVTGASTLDSAAVTNNATVGGTLGVTGNSTFSGTLGITGNTTVGGTLGITSNTTVGGTLGITGNTTVDGTLGVTGNTTVGGTLGVTSNTTVGGTLGVTGDTTFSGDVNVGSDTLEEYVQDTVGGMVTGNTETGLSVTYNDTNGKLNFALTKDPVITLTGDVTGTGTMTNLGNVSIATTVAANKVALGTDTTGNYVAGATAGTGVSISGTADEGWSPTIAIGQEVGTTSDVTFNTVTASLTGNASSASTAAALTGDVTRSGNFTVDATGDIILDADGNDFKFKNGAGGDIATLSLANTAALTLSNTQSTSIETTSSGADIKLTTLDRSGGVKIHSNASSTYNMSLSYGNASNKAALSSTGGLLISSEEILFETSTGEVTVDADLLVNESLILTEGASNWSFEVDTNNDLVIKYGTNTVFKLSTAGALTVESDINANQVL